MLWQWRRHGGMRGPDPPLMFRPLLRLAQIRWKVFLYMGDPMYVYCNFYCSPAKKKFSDPPLILGWWRHCARDRHALRRNDEDIGGVMICDDGGSKTEKLRRVHELSNQHSCIEAIIYIQNCLYCMNPACYIVQGIYLINNYDGRVWHQLGTSPKVYTGFPSTIWRFSPKLNPN